MKRIGVAAAAVLCSGIISGCLTVAKSDYKFAYPLGQFEASYHDIRSAKGVTEEDYSLERDWAILKERVAKGEKEHDPEVIEYVSGNLFQEGETLSAKLEERVKCPKCFPSKAAILTMLHDDDWHWKDVKGDVLLALPSGKKVIITNGQTFATDKNNYIIWPEGTEVFEYSVAEKSKGESLLPHYLTERSGKKSEEKQGKP